MAGARRIRSKRKGGEGYAKRIERLQVELAHLQAWVRKTGARIVVIFEGRDAAARAASSSASPSASVRGSFASSPCRRPATARNPRCTCSATSPTCRAAGEVVIFDRSWYTRPGVERVMGFCSEAKARRFLELVPRFEAAIVESGVTLLKYFLNVSEKEQEKRFRQRIEDPLRQWKLSPMDIESYRRWWDYSLAL